MASNHLEDLVAEWYQLRGYFVRRNIQVGKRAKGGYDCELDIVAFRPETRELVHLEPSLDTLSWEKRQARYAKKFAAGRKHIPTLFPGIDLPEHLEQVALFAYGGKGGQTHLAGGRILLVRELMQDILASLRGRRVASAAVPEEYPILRSLQFAVEYWPIARS